MNGTARGWAGCSIPPGRTCPTCRIPPSPAARNPSPPHPPNAAGRLPFEGKDKPEIKRNITANNLAALPSFLTPQCQSFIRAMLTYQPDARPSCAQLLQHPYIAMYCAPPPKPAALPNVIALHAYSPGAAGALGGGGCRRWKAVGWSGRLPAVRPHACLQPVTRRTPAATCVCSCTRGG